jgi:hypothetical protein
VLKTTFGRLEDLDRAALKARFDSLASLGIDLALVDLPDIEDPTPFSLLSELARRYAAA